MENRYHCHNRQKYSLKVPILLVIKYRKQILTNCITDDGKQKILGFCPRQTKGFTYEVFVG